MNEDTVLAAAPAGAETAATTEQPAGAPAGQPPQQGAFGSPMVIMLLMLAILYFVMIRPQQRKEKERRKMIEELRAGAKIVFAGGIIGTIIEATEKTFKVETASGTEMEILRSCVQGAVTPEGAAEAK